MGKIGNARSKPRPNTDRLDGQTKETIYVIQGGGRTSLNVNGKGWDTDISFTLNATDVHGIAYVYDARGNGRGGGYVPMVTKAYGFEPGVAQRLDPENRFYEEIATSLRANPGDNRASVAVCNFKADGSVGEGVAFAIVGDHENRPKDMTNLVVMESDENTNRKEILPLGRG